MKVVWDSHRPLDLYLVAETDADRVLVALLHRETSEVTISADIPPDVLARVSRHPSRAAEQAEDTALMLMEGVRCPHGARLTRECPACMGVVRVRVRKDAEIGTPLPNGSVPAFHDLCGGASAGVQKSESPDDEVSDDEVPF